MTPSLRRPLLVRKPAHSSRFLLPTQQRDEHRRCRDDPHRRGRGGREQTVRLQEMMEADAEIAEQRKIGQLIARERRELFSQRDGEALNDNSHAKSQPDYGERLYFAQCDF